MDFSLQNNPFLPLFQHYPSPESVSSGKTGSTAQGVIPKTQLPHGAEFFASLFAPPSASTGSSFKSLSTPYPPQPSLLYPPINPLLASTSLFQQALSSSLQAGVIPLPPHLPPREPCLPVLPPHSPNSIGMARKAPRRVPSTSQPTFKSRSPPPDRLQQQQQQHNQVPMEPVPPKCQAANWNTIFREQMEKTHVSWRTSETPRPLCSLQLQETGTLVPSLIDGEVIMGFNVWGEKRLCLPHLFRFVLNDVDLKAIDEACTQLQITCTTCSPAQLTLLHSRKILPPAVSSCGLIRKSDAERLIKYIRNRLDAPVELTEAMSDDSSTSSGIQPYKEQRHCEEKQTPTGPTDDDLARSADPAGDKDNSIAVDDVDIGNPLGDSSSASESPSKPTSTQAEDAEMTSGDKSDKQSTTSNDNDLIPVVHECFGRQLGLVHPDLYKQASSKCIECYTCHRLFAPDQFVGHTHTVTEVENLSHWGFDSTNWRCYLRLYTGRRLQGCRTLHRSNKTTSAGDSDKEPLFNVTEVYRRLEQFKIKFAQPIKLPASLSAALRTIGICASVAPIPSPTCLPTLDGRRPMDMLPIMPCVPPKSADGVSQRSSLGHVPPPSSISTAPIPQVVPPDAHCSPAAMGNPNPLLLPQLTLRRLWAPNDGRIRVPPPPIPNVKRDRKILPKKLNTGPPLVLHSHRVIARPATSSYDRDFIPNVCLLPSLSATKASSRASGCSLSNYGSGKFVGLSRHHRRGRDPAEKGLNGHSQTGSSSRGVAGRLHRGSRHQCRETSRSDHLAGVSRSCSSGSSPHWDPAMRSRSNSSSCRSQSSRRSGNRSESVDSTTSSVSSVSSTSSSCKSASSTSTMNSSRCSHFTVPTSSESLGASKTPALDHALQMETNVSELIEDKPFWKRGGCQDLLNAPAHDGERRLRRVMSLPTLLNGHGLTTSRSPLGLFANRGGHSTPRRPQMMRRSFSLSKSLLDLRAKVVHATSSRKHGKPSRLAKRKAVNGRDAEQTERKSRSHYEKDYLARQNRALAAAKAAQGFARRTAPGLWSRHFENLKKGETGPPDLPNARPMSKATWTSHNSSDQCEAISHPREPVTSNVNERSGLTSSRLSQPGGTPTFATPVLVTSPAKNSLPAAVLALEAIWSDLVRYISEYTVAVESKVGVAEARQRLFEQFISMQTYYATQIASLMSENRRLAEKLSAVNYLHPPSTITSTTTTTTATVGDEGLHQTATASAGSNEAFGARYIGDAEDRSHKRPLESPIRSGCPTQTMQPPNVSLAGAGSVGEGGSFSGYSSQVHPPAAQTLYPHKSRKEPIRSPIARRQPSFDLTSSEASTQAHDMAVIPAVIPNKPRLYERKPHNPPPANPLVFASNAVNSRYRGSSEGYTNHSDCEGGHTGAFSAVPRNSQTGKTSSGADKDEILSRKRRNSAENSSDAASASGLSCVSPDRQREGIPTVDIGQGGSWLTTKHSHVHPSAVANRALARPRQWDGFTSYHQQDRHQQPADEDQPQHHPHGVERSANTSKRSVSHVHNDADCRFDNPDAEAPFYRSNGDTVDCRTSCRDDESDSAPPEYKRRTLMPHNSSSASTSSRSQSFLSRFHHSPRMTLKPTSQKLNQ